MAHPNFPLADKPPHSPPVGLNPSSLHPYTTFQTYPPQPGFAQFNEYGALNSHASPLGPTISPQHAPYYGTMPSPQQPSPIGTLSSYQLSLNTFPQQPPVGPITNLQLPLGALPQQLSTGTPQMSPPVLYPAATVNIQGQPAFPTAAGLGQQYQAQQFGKCAMGDHAITSKFGVMGIICAIVFFPLGLICLMADRKSVCMRCGQVL